MGPREASVTDAGDRSPTHCRRCLILLGLAGEVRGVDRVFINSKQDTDFHNSPDEANLSGSRQIRKRVVHVVDDVYREALSIGITMRQGGKPQVGR